MLNDVASKKIRAHRINDLKIRQQRIEGIAMTQSLRLESNVMVPMRDDVCLATDIYSPAILVRNSYNKTFSEWDGVPDWYVR